MSRRRSPRPAADASCVEESASQMNWTKIFGVSFSSLMLKDSYFDSDSLYWDYYDVRLAVFFVLFLLCSYFNHDNDSQGNPVAVNCVHSRFQSSLDTLKEATSGNYEADISTTPWIDLTLVARVAKRAKTMTTAPVHRDAGTENSHDIQDIVASAVLASDTMTAKVSRSSLVPPSRRAEDVTHGIAVIVRNGGCTVRSGVDIDNSGEICRYNFAMHVYLV
jgi:hypothetical protein